MILLVSATEYEIQTFLHQYCKRLSNNIWTPKDIKYARILITGIGMVQTTLHLSKILMQYQFEAIVQIGFAGTFKEAVPLGELVYVRQDHFADLGVMKSIHHIEPLYSPNKGHNHAELMVNIPVIPSKKTGFEHLISRHVTGVSVNSCSATLSRANFMIKKFRAQVETMEGAAFYTVCNEFSIPSMQVRSISNNIPQQHYNWAINNARKSITEFMAHLLYNSPTF